MAPAEKKHRTAEYRSIVIRYRPGQRLAVIAGVLLSVLVLAAVAFRIGGDVREKNYQQLLEQKAHITALAEEYREALLDAEQAGANFAISSKVDRLAVEEIRQMVKMQQEQIAELKEENTFFKGLMAPSELEKGLSLRGWTVVSKGDDNRYQFKLIVQQLALKHRLLYGAAKVHLVGKQEGEVRTLSLHTLSEQLDNQSIKLRFKYFQNIEGELVIPAGFVPDYVDVVATATKPKAAKVEKRYPWQVK